jgi:TPR repeat protein/tRNA A-37 threonylcarbamoyl transferase component Bud32
MPSRKCKKEMKTCPQCDTGYSDSHITCPTHGIPLNEIRDLKPGMLIHNSYRIIRLLGKGGMGAVYLAEHTLMDEPRALKFLSPELSKDQAFTSRFLREVRTLRQVRHKSVVDCGDLERAEDDSLFFSMEYVNGPDLRSFLQVAPKPFDVGLALSITRGIAEGLGAAHAKGMVHRDIKPENILMAQERGDWVPKIADFGIVATKENSSVYTRTGGTLLTMAYAAPEQWRGTPAAELDGRTDLYALGGVLFEMLAGRTAFQAENYEGWARQHQNSAPVAPSTLRPELANWNGLDALVLGLLDKNPEKRPKDVDLVLSLLDQVQCVCSDTQRVTQLDSKSALNGSTATKGPKSSWNRRIGLLTAGLILTAAAAWYGLHQFQQRASSVLPQPQSTQSETEKPESVQSQPVSPSTLQPSNPKATSNQEPKPTQIEAQKPPAQPQNIPQMTKEADALYNQKRYAEAAPIYDRTCAGGQGTDCNRLATMYERGDGVAKDNSQAGTLYAKACFAGIGEGCDALIPMYAKRILTAQDVSRIDALFSNSCDAGNPHGCNGLGFIYEQGAGVSRDLSRAFSLYSKACDSNEARGCLNLAAMYANGNGVTRDFARAATLYSKSCDGGYALACANLGYGYENGIGVARDSSRAAVLYSKACDAGIAVGCGNLGVLYGGGNGVAKDTSRAVALSTRACDLGYALSCFNLGILYQNGNGATKDTPRAADLYSKACDGAVEKACFNLGLMYEKGVGVSRDYSRAANLYGKACDAGDVLGCSSLGYLYGSGNGVTKDIQRASALYTKACDGGVSISCTNLGFIYANGDGVPKDFPRAIQLFSKSCDSGEGRGCANLGYMYATASGVTKDIGRAKQLFDKGCSKGDQWACDRLKEVK